MRLDPLTLRRYPHSPVIRGYKLEGPPWIKPTCNDRLDGDADVSRLAIEWVDERSGIFGIGGGVNESGVGRAGDARRRSGRELI
jgi:hypothetical protein